MVLCQCFVRLKLQDNFERHVHLPGREGVFRVDLVEKAPFGSDHSWLQVRLKSPVFPPHCVYSEIIFSF